MNTKTFTVAALIIIIMGLGGWYWYSTKPDTDTADTTEDMQNIQDSGTSTMVPPGTPPDLNDSTGTTSPTTTTSDGSTVVEDTQPGTTSPETSIKEISVSAKNFEFSTKEIRVKKGERIKINLASTGGFHDFVIDEFSGAKTSRINTGESTSAEFTADKAGTFEFYCSVGTHRQMGMVGKLIVE